jgi:Restriction endonuclease
MTNESESGREFESRVAAIFRQNGFNVEGEYAIAGSRVDLLAWRLGNAGELRIAVSCKHGVRPVSLSALNAEAYFLQFLRDRGDVDVSLVISSGDFTPAAKEAASHHRVIPLTIDELGSFLAQPPSVTPSTSRDPFRPLEKRKHSFFVAMPFTKEYEDIFIIGIREVAEKLGVVALRLDEIEHNSSIPALIANKIKAADALIAETTEPNKNVFYEVGLAHGLGKEVIFLCKAGTKPPFDVAHINHILYGSLVELRTRLERRIRAMLERERSEACG